MDSQGCEYGLEPRSGRAGGALVRVEVHLGPDCRNSPGRVSRGGGAREQGARALGLAPPASIFPRRASRSICRPRIFPRKAAASICPSPSASWRPSRKIPIRAPHKREFYGELSLGRRAARNAQAAARLIHGARSGNELILPEANALEASARWARAAEAGTALSQVVACPQEGNPKAWPSVPAARRPPRHSGAISLPDSPRCAANSPPSAPWKSRPQGEHGLLDDRSAWRGQNVAGAAIAGIVAAACRSRSTGSREPGIGRGPQTRQRPGAGRFAARSIRLRWRR
jgi:hypothetical protein